MPTATYRRRTACRASVARAVLVSALAVLPALITPPTALAQLKDVAGSKDPAAIKRYDGSVIIGYAFSKFDDFTFLVGPVKRNVGSSKPFYVPTKTQRAEGQRTRIVYVVPEGRSPLEVLHNYQQDLSKGGFKTLYTCGRAECGTTGDGDLAERYLYTMETRLSDTPARGAGGPPGQVSEHAYSGAKDQHFFVAHRTGTQGEAWISVYVAMGTFSMHKETAGHAIVLLDLVEAAPMDTKMVLVDASAMAKDISATGHVALYGILFDTDKTDLKPESSATIEEIATLLKQDAGMQLYVVGHTDNVGGYDYNVALSQRRAATVVKELIGRHGISAARLKPAGTGPLAPVASNGTDAGRAKNRRVELVRQ